MAGRSLASVASVWCPVAGSQTEADVRALPCRPLRGRATCRLCGHQWAVDRPNPRAPWQGAGLHPHRPEVAR